MKVNKNIKIILSSTVLLSMLTSIFISAKFIKKIDLFDKSRVANFIVQTTELTENNHLIINQNIPYTQYSFKVLNYIDDNISEVSLTYHIIISWSKTSPLLQQVIMYLVCDSYEFTSPQIEYADDKVMYIFNQVGLFLASVKQEHFITLFVTSQNSPSIIMSSTELTIEIEVEQISS